jgi:hypothetical protein
MHLISERKTLGPVSFSELLIDNGESFSDTMEKIMIKLSQLNDTMIEIKNFEQLLESLKEKAAAEGSGSDVKVAIVDSMVNQFIRGNSLRAQQTLSKPTKPNQAMIRAKEVLENFEQNLKSLEEKKRKKLKEFEESTTTINSIEEEVNDEVVVIDSQKDNIDVKDEKQKPGRVVHPVDQPTSTIRTKGYDVNIGTRAPVRSQPESTTEESAVDNNSEDIEVFDSSVQKRPVMTPVKTDDDAELKKLLHISSVAEVKRALVKKAQTDPRQTARLLASLFEYSDPSESQNTVEEIRDMISKDLEAVTDAFADLIMKKRREKIASLEEGEAGDTETTTSKVVSSTASVSTEANKKSKAKEEADLFTPEVPHFYKDPPKAVQGQLLRYWSNEEHEQHHHHEDAGHKQHGSREKEVQHTRFVIFHLF